VKSRMFSTRAPNQVRASDAVSTRRSWHHIGTRPGSRRSS
jgi:hypothetical protein